MPLVSEIRQPLFCKEVYHATERKNRFCKNMNRELIIRINEAMNWILTNVLLSNLPFGDSPKLPFSTSAGGKEVI